MSSVIQAEMAGPTVGVATPGLEGPWIKIPRSLILIATSTSSLRSPTRNFVVLENPPSQETIPDVGLEMRSSMGI